MTEEVVGKTGSIKGNLDRSAEIERIKGASMTYGFCFTCPYTCLTEVYVRDGKIVYVKGHSESPNKDSRCAKGEAGFHVTQDPDRLRHPMKRVGERGERKFERITWDEAFTIIAEKLKEIKEKYGPESVVALWHIDPNCVFLQILLTQLYGTPNCYDHGAACDQNHRVAALSLFGHPFPTMDLERSRYIMLWGMNMLEANRPMFESIGLFKALERGAKLVVVDPRLTQTAEKANEWIPIKPGTDGALALTMARVIVDEGLYDVKFVSNWTHGFNQFRAHLIQKRYTPEWAESITDIPAQTIRRLAREFATTRPAIAEGFKGLCDYSNGVDAARAVYILNVITGNVDGPGNIILFDTAPLKWPVVVPKERREKIGRRPPLHQAMGYPLAPALPTGLLPQAVLEGKPYPVKAILWYHINPVMSEMNTDLYLKMLRELEFSVAIELYMAETALECDLVLPSASFYESAEIRPGTWMGPQVLLGQPVVKPVGESKPLYEIIKKLSGKMGHGEYFQYEGWEDWAKTVISRLPITLEELKKKGFWHGKVEHYKFKKKPLRTPSGKIEIWSRSFADNGYNPLPEYSPHKVIPDDDYPLQLGSSKLGVHCNVVTQNNPYLMEITGENWVELNPLDAHRYGIEDGDYVIIESPLNKATIKARVIEGVRPGVACVRQGHGFGHWAMGSVARGKGAHVNSLIDTNINPISGGNGYNECKVRVEKA